MYILNKLNFLDYCLCYLILSSNVVIIAWLNIIVYNEYVSLYTIKYSVYKNISYTPFMYIYIYIYIILYYYVKILILK